jgi:hypothetical protein
MRPTDSAMTKSRPAWTHQDRSPREPDFEAKACQALDLYEGRWKGKPLQPTDCVVSADEKSGIQALKRCHPILPPSQGRAARVEHEYPPKGDSRLPRRLGCAASQALWPL